MTGKKIIATMIVLALALTSFLAITNANESEGAAQTLNEGDEGIIICHCNIFYKVRKIVDPVDENAKSDNLAVALGVDEKVIMRDIVIPSTITHDGTKYNVIGVKSESAKGSISETNGFKYYGAKTTVQSITIGENVGDIYTDCFKGYNSVSDVTFLHSYTPPKRGEMSYPPCALHPGCLDLNGDVDSGNSVQAKERSVEHHIHSMDNWVWRYYSDTPEVFGSETEMELNYKFDNQLTHEDSKIQWIIIIPIIVIVGLFIWFCVSRKMQYEP